MSGVYSEEDKLTGVWSHTFNDIHFINLIKNYQAFLEQFIKRDAGILMVQHTGGLDSFVMSSCDLTKKIQLHHPSLKLINSLISAQNSAYGSCGFYVGILCLSLLNEYLELEHYCGLSRRVVKDIAEEIMSDIVVYLDSKPKYIVKKLDTGNLTEIMTYMNSFIINKNLCLNKSEFIHVKTQLVRAFLESLDENDSNDCFGEVVIKIIEGRPATEADVVKGILYKVNDPNLKYIDDLKQFSQTKRNDSNSVNSLNYFPLILFDIPLSYEKSKTESLKYFGNISNKDVYNGIIIEQLLKVVHMYQINIIACQKFIDDEIKYELEKKGILVLERLGTSQTKAVQKLTGCVKVSDISWLLDNDIETQNDWIGKVTDVNLMEIGRSSYLQILNKNSSNKNTSSVVTLILPVMTSAMEENIQAMVENCLKNLRHLSLNPHASVGSGCLESSIVNRISRYKPSLRQLDVTEAEFILVRKAVFKVFGKLAVHLNEGVQSSLLNFSLHSASGHLKYTADEISSKLKNLSVVDRNTCCCGSVYINVNESTSPLSNYCKDSLHVKFPEPMEDHNLMCSNQSNDILLDNYIAKFNAIKSAFQCASQLYEVNYCIFDK